MGLQNPGKLFIDLLGLAGISLLCCNFFHLQTSQLWLESMTSVRAKGLMLRRVTAKARHICASHTQRTNGLNEELIGFSEADSRPSESFKFLGSVESSQTDNEDRQSIERQRKGQIQRDSF